MGVVRGQCEFATKELVLEPQVLISDPGSPTFRVTLQSIQKEDQPA